MLANQSLQAVRDVLEKEPSTPPQQLIWRWFAIRSELRKEHQAAGGLIGHRIKTYLPEIPRRRLYGRKMRTVLVPMLPNYLLVQLPQGNEPWGRIRTTPGVLASNPFVKAAGGSVSPIPNWAIDIIRAVEREETEGPAPITSPFKIGDEVQVMVMDARRQIVDSFKAAVKDLSKLRDKGRATVASQWMGRLVDFDVEISQLRPA